MDPCTFFVCVFVYLIVCFGILCASDSDLITAIYSRIQKDSVEAFENKVVWITGASSGIGEGIAKQLCKSTSVKIVLSARRKDQLERVKRECLALNRSKKSSDILILQLNMVDYSSHEPALKKVLENFGKLDILVSNAGRSQHAEWHNIEPSVDKELFDVNVFSLVNLNRIVLRYFFTVGGGHLAVTSSIAGKIATPYYGGYPASKFALHGYFESLRNETAGKNIAVTLICPGPVTSEIRMQAFTSVKGEKMGLGYAQTDKRMSADRCGYLCVVALANKLQESWVAPAHIILATYFAAYQPYLFAKTLQLLGALGLIEKAMNITKLTSPSSSNRQ